MKINFKQIINIKNIKELKKYNINKPVYLNNYLFHYLIIFNKLDILKLDKFPIYKEDEEGLNGFFLAAKYDNIEILKYLIEEYPDYIYRPKHKLGTMPTLKTTTFTHTPYMPLTINITNPNQTHSFTKKENKDKTNASTYNSKMNLTINFNDNWLTYKEGYNYYEAIELFYSKL